MRKTNELIKSFINQTIAKNSSAWRATPGSNFGIPLQRLIKDYYLNHQDEWDIASVVSNENPNSTEPDIVITYNDGRQRKFEVKSCKEGALNGVTICNSPELLNDTDTYLINYIPDSQTRVIRADSVYETQLFRLTSIQSSGKYRGCLISTRDTGKKIKGRNFSEFESTSDADDYPLSTLLNPELIHKTVLYYSASKLVDDRYNFTDDEILEAVHNLRKRR